MKSDEINNNSEIISEASKNASESLNWLLNANPNIKNLVEKFDLEVVVKPKSRKAKIQYWLQGTDVSSLTFDVSLLIAYFLNSKFLNPK